MGWWIRGQSGQSKRKPASKAKSRSAADPSRRAARWRAVLWVVVVAGVGAGLYFGQTMLVDRVGNQHAAQVHVELVNAPAWMGENRLEGLRRTVRDAVTADPLDQASLEQAAAEFNANAWVERVVRIHRLDYGKVTVEAVYRQPVALVGARDGFHLVDHLGHRLPGVYPYEQLKQLGLPAITGVRAAPPNEGDMWPGQDVQAGITLAMRLAREPFAKQVRGIDVANYDGRSQHGYPHLTLITTAGAVRWGRAVGREEIYEPPADEKLAMLRRVNQSHGSIDAGGQVVDVYLDTPMIHAAGTTRYTSMRE